MLTRIATPRAADPEQDLAKTRAPVRVDLAPLKVRIQRQLVSELGPDADLNDARSRRFIETLFNEVVAELRVPLSRAERAQLFQALLAELLSFGPIEPLLADETVSEIMVNGPDQVWVERKGQLIETDVRFDDDEHVRRIMDRIIAPLGRRLDESSPMVDARLPDGSRVNAIIPPLALNGTVVTIRKFPSKALVVDDLVKFGSMSRQLADFLGACVTGKLNMIVAGGTGSGKTTLLNVLSAFIPNDDRIITIEDAAELQLVQRHVIRLEKRAANIEGKGEVPIRQLVMNSLRMRPDRLIVGECRGPEALDMLQAMNTGHDGSMTTLHANSPRDTIARLETLILMAGVDLPLRAIREQVASAVDLIVYQERLVDGTRKVIKATEVQGMEQDVVVLQDVFAFQHSGLENGKIVGQHASIGIRPKFLAKLEQNGVRIPDAVFQVGATDAQAAGGPAPRGGLGARLR